MMKNVFKEWIDFMKCPNCGSNKIFTCTDETKYPNERYFNCVNCSYQSRRVKIFPYRCVNYKSDWEIELEKLEQEWK